MKYKNYRTLYAGLPKIKTIRNFALSFIVLLLSACSSISKIENKSVSQIPQGQQRYSVNNYSQNHPVGDTMLLLAFSGGGTRAAALSYGVLEELRDTRYHSNEKELRLLDEVDRISSVSGGSFTSAYYGLFGDKIFDDFKDVFLYKDVQDDLTSRTIGLFDTLKRTFSTRSRIEIAVDYYDKHIFQGKTFADMQKSGGPFILINASDLNSRSQFLFVQQQFDFLCSDLSQFKIARAVAASSAVPILFPPILLERHDNCHYEKPVWLSHAEEKAKQEDNFRLKDTVRALNYYLDENNPPYATLLDGGMTDNLGLRAILNTVSLSGGMQNIYDKTYKDKKTARRIVVIVVDAATNSETDIGKSKSVPSVFDTLSVVTDMQLHLYNTETNSLLKQELMQWVKAISTEEYSITPFFIDLNIDGIEDQSDREFFNQVPTSFSLKKVQADKIIELGRKLLRNNPEFQKLLHQLDIN